MPEQVKIRGQIPLLARWTGSLSTKPQVSVRARCVSFLTVGPGVRRDDGQEHSFALGIHWPAGRALYDVEYLDKAMTEALRISGELHRALIQA